MADTEPKATIEAVAALMEEFRLAEARLQLGELSVAFRRRPATRGVAAVETIREIELETIEEFDLDVGEAPAPPTKGVPVVSPMNGIFYAASNPGSPPFARVGESIAVGQVIGLIEAMKVFNEIPSTVAGTVIEIVAQTAQIVSPGDPLVLIEPES